MKKSWSDKDSDCWVKERETLTYHIGFKIHNPSWIIKEMKTRHSADKMVTMPSTRITGSLDSLANQLLRITSRVSLSSDGIPTICFHWNLPPQERLIRLSSRATTSTLPDHLFIPTREIDKIIITSNNYNIAWSQERLIRLSSRATTTTLPDHKRDW